MAKGPLLIFSISKSRNLFFFFSSFFFFRDMESSLPPLVSGGPFTYDSRQIFIF